MKPQLMTITEIKHYRNGECIWFAENIGNTWHLDGQEFVLANSFATNMGITVPANYYVGLDNRSTINATDTLPISIGTSLEPQGNGYQRYALSSTTGFVVGLNNGSIIARSGICTFTANTNSWNIPVSNVFLASTIDNTGHLIASSALPSSNFNVLAGESITVRLTLSFSS